MPGLRLTDVAKQFGPVTAVREVTLAIPHGRFVCFLGPSGCGKTTLLRLIAGLERPSRGRIFLDDADITELPAHRREFGMVFQSLALFPHLTVGENIAYSLRIRRRPEAECRRRVEELLELVRLPGYAGRGITQLSGGERQRVAIARALATSPRLFLLDEPLSALDAKLREGMQLELRLLQQRLAVTTVLVTHDQREAMTMSDLIVVMGPDNRVHQVGSPLDIYRRPADTFVADFIGTSNLLRARLAAGLAVEVHGHTVIVESLPAGALPGAALTLSVRPEEVAVVPGAQPGENRLPGRVAFVRDVGSSVEIHLDCAGLQIVSQSTPKGRPAVGVGDEATAVLPPAACVVLPA